MKVSTYREKTHLVVGIIIGTVMAMIVMVLCFAHIQGIPCRISDLERGKIYTRPDKHQNIVLFVTEDNDAKVAFLSEDCPQRFMVVDDNGTLRTVPVPPVEK